MVAFAVAGGLLGLLWRHLWSPAHGVVQQHQWFPQPFDSGEQHDFAGNAWYVVIALVAGIVLALAAVIAMRSPEFVTLAAVTLGSVAAGLLMWRVGLIGNPGDPAALAKHAADGTRLSSRLHLANAVPLTAFPLGALGMLAAAYLTTSRRPPEPVAEEGFEPASHG